MESRIIEQLLDEVKQKIDITYFEQEIWNPMEEFAKYCAPKEICHSRIIAQLLNPNGVHNYGSVFFDAFYHTIGTIIPLSTSEPKDIKISTERKINNGRRIDIFIEWIEEGREKCCLIIENKLNNASYQPNQLQDYRESILGEGYTVKGIICLHPYSREEDKMLDADLVLYPYNIANILEDCIEEDSLDPLCAYISYLRNLSSQHNNMTIANQLLDLDYAHLSQITSIVKAFKHINEAKNRLLLDCVLHYFPNISYEIGKLNGDEQISFWRKEDFDLNGCKVCVHYPKNPEDDDNGTDLYLICKPENNEVGTEYANMLGLTFVCEEEDSNGQNALWYKAGTYVFFDKEQRNQLIECILKILKRLKVQ